MEVSHKLAIEKIYSKVVSVPCQELFEQQSTEYKNKTLNEADFTITIEAGSTESWHKFVRKKGLNFGIDEFGKSAPFKEIYKHFGLTAENISKKTINLIKN